MPAQDTIAESVKNMDIVAVICYYVRAIYAKNPLETILKPA